ncbi:DUF3152 domain-containing protein [Streptomyces sp. NPDC006798]|uniref:DUF3152 domain-containing protein n=1 Tax=Streptomyces sp. NPDC006798 TaxID=3155462 RepID=UPI0033C9031C
MGRHSRKGPAPKGSPQPGTGPGAGPAARPDEGARTPGGSPEPYAGGDAYDTFGGGVHGGDARYQEAPAPAAHPGHGGGYGGSHSASHGGDGYYGGGAAVAHGGGPGPQDTGSHPAYPSYGTGTGPGPGSPAARPFPQGQFPQGGPAPHGSAPHAPQGPAAGAGGHGRPAGYGPEHTASGYGAAPATRGGHPEQHEAGGGWGTGAGTAVPPHTSPEQAVPGARRGRRGATGPGGVPGPGGAPAGPSAGSRIPGPRREFVDAFGGPGAGTRAPDGPGGPGGPDGEPPRDRAGDTEPEADASLPGQRPPLAAGKGRTLTGIAAAAVTTVLAVVVAGQVATENERRPGISTSDTERADDSGAASRSVDRRQPPPVRDTKPQAPTYDQLMATQFPVDRKLTAGGTFKAVPGFDKAPGKGKKVRYRVDIEDGLQMDGVLFATAVQRTLNDRRSWAGDGDRTFERISTGRPDFVITLASPGTTDVWCAKSDLITSISTVSCDSALTERVMINAYRWGLGSDTFGPDKMYAYRQMLINHEVGHRLGFGHVDCDTEGELAPVMMQQTKSLVAESGVRCRPNPWVHPGG